MTKPQTTMFAVRSVDEEYILPRIASLLKPLRVAVLISGTGEGLNALLAHQKISRTHSTKLILSNNSNAYGLIYGNKYNIRCKVVPLPKSTNKDLQRLMHEDLINKELLNSKIELIVLNGYMRVLTPSFVSKWKGKIINIHPSLLPNFQEQMLIETQLMLRLPKADVRYIWLMMALIRGIFWHKRKYQ